MAVAQNIQSEESKALEAALQLAVAYFACTSDEVGMTGLSVTLPYGDLDFYEELSDVFSNSGLEEEYVNWLGRFVRASGVQDRYDYEDWYENEWSGWDSLFMDFDWLIWLLEE